MCDGLWVPSTASSAADIPDGGALEELMCRSLEDNAYSVQGFWLWQSRAIQQRRHREQGRRRPRGETDSSARERAASEAARNPAEAAAEQRAEEVRSYIAALLHATGYPYRAASITEEEEERTVGESVDPTSTAEEASASVTHSPAAPADGTAASVAQADGNPAKVARVESNAGEATSSTASSPKSALAKLVAKAKAQHRDLVGDAPVVTVVPASKNPPFPEDLPGMLTARGSSTTTAAARKRVQFADVPPGQSTSGQVSRGKANHAKDGDDEEEDFGVVLPGHTSAATSAQSERSDRDVAGETHEGGDVAAGEDSVAAKHPSQMTRAEFLSQFKRAPRRGEIGQTAEDIAAAEELGYVMSGSRSVASRMYVDRVQRQLHEHEAAKLQQQFRKVEDERMDDQLVHGLVDFVMSKKKKKKDPAS